MGLVTKTTIYLGGKVFSTSFNSLTLYQEINDHHHLEIAFRMDMFENLMAKTGGSTTSIFGERLSVEIADVDSKSKKGKLQFVGLITQVRKSKTDYSGDSDEIVIIANSPTITMDNGPHCRAFTKKTVSDIAKTILNEHGIKSEIHTTPFMMPYITQHNESSFDFLCRLAAQNGLWCYYNGEKFVFGKEPSSNDIKLNYRDDLKEFSLSMSPQPKNFSYRSYDAKKNEYAEGSGKPEQSLISTSIKDDDTNVIVNVASGSISNLTSQAEAQYQSLLTKELRLSGISSNPGIRLGSVISTKDADITKFKVIKITHSCNEIGNYENRFEAVAADGKASPYTNVRIVPEAHNQIGIVVNAHEDPEGLGRIQVRLPYQHDSSDPVWMRMLTPYAGTERGVFFLPEVGDEVLVGFEGGNAEHPYIIGSLYNNGNLPTPFEPDMDNTFKGIKTKSQLKIEFEDIKRILTIETPAGNKFILNDDENSINVEDSNGNKITMDDAGILFDSQKDIIMKADGNISLEATGHLDMKAIADATLEGANITQKAQAQYKAEGAGTAEISSSGQTTVKGSIVMIN